MKEKAHMHAALQSKVNDWDNRKPLKDQLTMQQMLLYWLEPSSTSSALAVGNVEYHDLF